MKQLSGRIKNKQWQISKRLMFLCIIFFLLMILPFTEGNFLTGAWALVMISLFLGISFFAAALIFRNRARKLDKLLQNITLIAEWDMDDNMRSSFAKTLRKEANNKSKAAMWIIGIFFVVFTVLFLFLLEDDEISFFLILMGSVFLLIFMASRFFPWYYYRKNSKGDGKVMIGEKFAYFNGYFHNWDYPLSGLSKIKVIKTPFSGLLISYYYTDLTLVHSHTIRVPLPEEIDPDPIIYRLKMTNKSSK